MTPGERLCDFARQNGVKDVEIDHCAARFVDHGTNSYFNTIEMAMYFGRTTFRKLMCRVERDSPGERTLRPAGHKTKPIPNRSSGVIVYWFARPVGLTALETDPLPGCFVGSCEYDTG